MRRFLAVLVLLAACDEKSPEDTSTTGEPATTEPTTPEPAADAATGTWTGSCAGHVATTYGTPEDLGYYEADVLLEPAVLDIEVVDGRVTGTLEGTQVFSDGYPSATFSADLEGAVDGIAVIVETIAQSEYEAVMTFDLVLSGNQLTGTVVTTFVSDPLDCTFDRS